ncbi:MAG: 4Fe-4S dicluster domain-containing protein [Candidatus Hadarchaeum sp.]
MQRLSQYDPKFKDEVMAEPGGENLIRCYSCGTCMATCLIRRHYPDYNPRRILRMAILGMRQEVLGSHVIWRCSACDDCYRHCPQGIRISDLFKAFRALALREGYSPPGPVARVNERTCVGCGLCVEVCPYDAVELVKKRVLGHEKTVAQVNAARCMSCGVCAASCRSASIDLLDHSDERLLQRVQQELLEVAA